MMNNEKVRLLLVGIGGYASTYVNPLLDGKRPDAEIVGAVDVFPEGCKRLAELKALGVPLFSDMSEFFAAGLKADLAVITTPIHLHARMIKTALAQGCHVLCEKPLCGDVNDIPTLKEARDAAGKYVGIGYQWSHSEAILALKEDIMAGLYGDPVLLKTFVLWPRGYAYYGRGTGWAGKLRAKDGSLILDSVANNATAHYLHNILFVLGKTIDTSAMPETVDASLWRANDIENYDTASIELGFAGGARGLFIVSHATDKKQEPIFDYQFTKGRITFAEDGGKMIRGTLADGTVKEYGNPFDNVTNKLYRAMDAVKDPTIRPVCGIEAAEPHARVIARAQLTGVKTFPAEEIVEKEDGSGRYAAGLYEELCAAYKEGKMWRR